MTAIPTLTQHSHQPNLSVSGVQPTKPQLIIDIPSSQSQSQAMDLDSDVMEDSEEESHTTTSPASSAAPFPAEQAVGASLAQSVSGNTNGWGSTEISSDSKNEEALISKRRKIEKTDECGNTAEQDEKNARALNPESNELDLDAYEKDLPNDLNINFYRHYIQQPENQLPPRYEHDWVVQRAFMCVVQWMVYKALHPSFERNDGIYSWGFRTIEQRAKDLIHSVSVYPIWQEELSGLLRLVLI